jgi:hypothetical protein
VTCAVDVRARVVVVATAVLLLVTVAARSELGRPLANPIPRDRTAAVVAAELVTAFDGSAIVASPADVVPASDRPVVAGAAKRADGQRAPSLAPNAGAAAAAWVRLVWDVPLHGSLTSVGPVALGLTRRGPPAAGDR